ncbi:MULTISPECIES: hypothetical protein [Burkholderia cepacia complex]|uniref:hypothetical protein n=1 Tax=Burkholderia cepacia complex TaxID=87882 RepID=UPI001E4D35C6|nr:MULTISPECIES: hypothetical protein [Burkholderia cepacia complex]
METERSVSETNGGFANMPPETGSWQVALETIVRGVEGIQIKVAKAGVTIDSVCHAAESGSATAVHRRRARWLLVLGRQRHDIWGVTAVILKSLAGLALDSTRSERLHHD